MVLTPPPHIKNINDTVLLDELAGIAMMHFKRAFGQDGGMTNNSLNGWQERKRDYPHDILYKTGELMRKISVTNRKFNSITIGIPSGHYGEYHNSGVPSRNLPKREFVGESDDLQRKLKEHIESNLQHGR